jgi:hypothetical protein
MGGHLEMGIGVHEPDADIVSFGIMVRQVEKIPQLRRSLPADQQTAKKQYGKNDYLTLKYHHNLLKVSLLNVPAGVRQDLKVDRLDRLDLK